MRFWLGKKIEVGPRWFSPPLWHTDELIDGADVMAGFRFARLEHVRRYKRALDRPKDRADIAAIDAHLAAG